MSRKGSSGRRKIKEVSIKTEASKLLNTVAVKLSNLEKNINSVKDSVKEWGIDMLDWIVSSFEETSAYVKRHPFATATLWTLLGVGPVEQMYIKKFVDGKVYTPFWGKIFGDNKR